MLKKLNAFNVLISCVLLVIESQAISVSRKPATNTTASPVTVKSINGFTASTGVGSWDGLTKRDAQTDKFSVPASHGAKSYEPLPEYYTQNPCSPPAPPHARTSPFDNRDEKSSFTFPHDSDSQIFVLDGKNPLKPQQKSEEIKPTGSRNADNERQSLHQRISVDVGRHNNVDHESENSQGYINDYELYEKHLYVPTTAADGRTYSPEYNFGHAGCCTSGYCNNNAGVLPFDFYGPTNVQKKCDHYSGSGGEYSYTQYPLDEYPYEHAIPKGYHPYSEVGHHHHPNGYDYSKEALLAKSFVIPLASAAVLGITAALVSNPLFLQLGTISGGTTPVLVGKRKRRAVKYKHIGHGVDNGVDESDDGVDGTGKTQKQMQQKHIEEQLNQIDRRRKQRGQRQKQIHQKKTHRQHNRLEVQNLLLPYRGHHHS